MFEHRPFLLINSFEHSGKVPPGNKLTATRFRLLRSSSLSERNSLGGTLLQCSNSFYPNPRTFWYITRRFEHFLHESSNVSLNLRTEGVSTTANCGLLASLCSGSSSVRYLVETEYISLPDAKHSGLAHFSFEHSGKYLHLNVRTKTRFS